MTISVNTTDPQPSWLTFTDAAIPADLKALPQWVCWRPKPNGSRVEKIPVNAATGTLASWTFALSPIRRTRTTSGSPDACSAEIVADTAPTPPRA